MLFKHSPALRVLAVSLCLVACASEPYIVLLDNDDGTTGKVLVKASKGTTLLEKTKQATIMGDTVGNTFIVTEQQLQTDFGAALAAKPIPAKIFLLYFEKGSSTLTKASLDKIPEIVAEIKRRPAPDISVIGHSDTMGNDRENEKLSLERAALASDLMIKETQLPVEKVSVDSHGEKNLLIKTPDETEEPRNRRVEVTVR